VASTMAPLVESSQEGHDVMAAGAAARKAGNTAFNAGDMDTAASHYSEALTCWKGALSAEAQTTALEVGQLVQYCDKGYFGEVMSCFPLFDEYFLKDMGSDQAIWVGDPGRDLRRFSRKELVAVTRELMDFRLAVLQNLAAVCNRQGKWEQAVKWADQALCIQGRAPKALMRKGSALLRLNLPGPASDVLATAAEEVPTDVEVRRLLREAEQRRSPTWICATGCCGPWGIVCGGPISQTVPEVVAPAAKKQLEHFRDGAEADAPTAEIVPEIVLAPEQPQPSSNSAAAAISHVEAVAKADRAFAGAGCEPTPPSSSVAANGVTLQAESAAEMRQISEPEAPDSTAAAAESCRARRTASSPLERPAVEQRKVSTEKRVAGLIYLAAGSFLVAMLAAVWMLSLPAGG